MAEDNFKKFKKRYQEGKISTTQMPPLPAGMGRGVGRAAARAVADSAAKWGPVFVGVTGGAGGVEYLEHLANESQKKRRNERNEAAAQAQKKAASDKSRLNKAPIPKPRPSRQGTAKATKKK